MLTNSFFIQNASEVLRLSSPMFAEISLCECAVTWQLMRTTYEHLSHMWSSFVSQQHKIKGKKKVCRRKYTDAGGLSCNFTVLWRCTSGYLQLTNQRTSINLI